MKVLSVILSGAKNIIKKINAFGEILLALPQKYPKTLEKSIDAWFFEFAIYIIFPVMKLYVLLWVIKK